MELGGECMLTAEYHNPCNATITSPPRDYKGDVFITIGRVDIGQG